MSEDWSKIDIEEFDSFTGEKQFNAVYTITLNELIDAGVFSWSLDLLDWSDSAFDDEQYTRVCAYFIERFRYREISVEPFKEWCRILRRKIVYELMPKFKPLYERVAEGINPLSSENEYYKNRTINSAYPETLLSENADYITDGRDEEFQRIKEGPYVDMVEIFTSGYKSVDELLLDELECMFISMYTTNINGTW